MNLACVPGLSIYVEKLIATAKKKREKQIRRKTKEGEKKRRKKTDEKNNSFALSKSAIRAPTASPPAPALTLLAPASATKAPNEVLVAKPKALRRKNQPWVKNSATPSISLRPQGKKNVQE